ncbi:amino acid ABC transporter substrate-binding protein [Dactylosporangium sucinum]|uniref:Branched-chain amino acid ABC transporter substrate-binding protein n=1 Tax=Dactylosporangium sucinum TaxID=1424081 RepID=A0A917T115_9ACTN|nr:amino acid ABC transporter substrate-binding protein [Dactylosporangium sucinum]GGM06443.1 branched-chain amino acid ABC transporter substrate-binding protein [Dactylosporangium sucinum]
MRRRSLVAAAVATALVVTGCNRGSGDGGSGGSSAPIVVGSTLSLTGAFAATGQIHKIAGEEFVERLNAAGGLLGRKVEWKVLDDQSDQAKVSQLYERLISQDKVDLILGPYATPNILSAMAVAQRHGYILPQHSAVLAPQLTYECQFPAWSIGPTPNSFIPNQLFDALASLPTPPKTVAVLTSQSGSAAFVSDGFGSDKAGALSIAKERGITVVADVHYPPTTTDWAPIATQVRDANPDLVINNGLGVDAVNILQAMKQLNYRPKQMFGLFPAPGPLLALGDLSDGMLSVSMFEPNKPILDKLGAQATEITTRFTEKAKAANLPYTVFETQATASWNAWEILTGAVKATGGTDQQKLCDSLHANGVDTTFSGHLTFDPKSFNFWPTTQTLKQIQKGDWVVVWPADKAAAPLAARRP